MRLCTALFIMFLACVMTSGAFAGTFYARGTHYAGKTDIWSYDVGNQLFDDGLHEDGDAADGVFGAFVTSDQPPGFHEFKIANADWTQNYPLNPEYPLANAVLFTFEPGEVIHFRLDTNALTNGWQPAEYAVACSHFTWPGSAFELIGSPPELGSWLQGVPAFFAEGVWYAVVTIAEPGLHEYKFRFPGTWEVCNIGIHYNMFLGDNFSFETNEPLTTLRFEFNPQDGRARATDEGVITTREGTWGAFKNTYRLQRAGS